MKLAEVAPAGIETLDGGVALESDDVKLTSIPPIGDAPLKVTVPVAEVPPPTVDGVTVKLMGVGGLIVILAVAKEMPRVALMVAIELAATGIVVMLNVAVVEPAATVTVVGTVALSVFELRETEIPLVGAGPAKVTMPTEIAPPITGVGATLRPVTVGGVTVRVTVADPPGSEAVKSAAVEAATGFDVTVNVAVT